jgi:hypothetical protein
MNTKLVAALCVFFACVGSVQVAYPQSILPLKTADEILRHREMLKGKDYRISGFARFDRLSRRGFLYGGLSDLRKHNRKKTIFLQLDLKRFAKLQINDEQYVIVTGYLAEEMHGPLGSYPAHVIVDRIELAQAPSVK